MLILIFLAILKLVSCSNYNENIELQESLESIVKDKNIEAFDLNLYTDFEWERAHIFYPYTTDEEINDVLGVDFNEQTGLISSHDGYTLLVFINDNKLAKHVLIPTWDVELQKGTEGDITPTNPIIKINRK